VEIFGTQCIYTWPTCSKSVHLTFHRIRSPQQGVKYTWNRKIATFDK